MRLNLYVAKTTNASRRGADLLIKSGSVKVNSEIVRTPFTNVTDKDTVVVHGHGTQLVDNIYLIFNKPEGVTTTLKDKFAKKKIIDFLPQVYKHVYPVGRLDKNSKGLIILTNDGNLCYKLTHPKFEVEKEYFVKVLGDFKVSDCCLAVKGLYDEDDLLKVKQISIAAQEKKTSSLKIVVCEGKKRHLRRLFKKLGYKVLELKRVRIGNLVLGGLKEGTFKIIKKSRIRRIFPGIAD